MSNDMEQQDGSKRPVILEALRVSLGRPAVWITTWFCMALIVLSLTLPYVGWFASALADYAPRSQFFSLTEAFRADHASDMSTLSKTTSRAAAGVGFLALFIGVFAAGGWLQVILERTHGQSLRRFFLGGARYFWRFFRLLIVSLLLLHVLGWVLYEWPWDKLVLDGLLDIPKHDYGALSMLGSERQAVNLGFVRDGLYALGFGAILIWGVFTRTRIALNDTSSVLISGIAALFTIVRHPIMTLRPMLLIFLLEAGLLVGIGFASSYFQNGLEASPSMISVLILFLLGQLGLMIREAFRGAGYCAAVRVSQDLVVPEREDQWEGSIGGPGGPRYPIGEEADEYGVSM